MANKLVNATQLDSDLTSVANAIRSKTGESGDLTFPSEFVSEIGSIGGESDFIVPKYVEDFRGGYIANTTFVYDPNDAYSIDLWQVIQGHEYMVILRQPVGNRCRGIFTTTDLTTVTGDISNGTILDGTITTEPGRARVLYGDNFYSFVPSTNGYIALMKSNQGNHNIRSYLLDLSAPSSN